MRYVSADNGMGNIVETGMESGMEKWNEEWDGQWNVIPVSSFHLPGRP